ncbi:hypothetical protein [Bacillus velezensis]|uniref:hypothetical protein n=1 Tax=Bacillus velezensis TaxID=492670 RepID=UPI000654E37D|nr:hypothetical protein [Bacillus velezensis]AKL78399.1 hypothetical protein ABH13_3825 [Bacillus velezensis]MCG0589040.1 hypothetical protein [Bacillus velezensis]MCM3371630.1 hypothetical protein [Bacillus velezensis]MDF9766429.1 putative transcriptional regulator [Bacillus velezensis]MDF9781649.1 putative transcriptional regulator [Bacillus velezensis]
MSNVVLQSFLEKVIAKKILDKLNSIRDNSNIKQTHLSTKAGKSDNAFNKMLNEMKVPKISTVLRYLDATNELLKENKMNEITIDELLEIVRRTNNITDGDFDSYIEHNKDFLKGITFYFEIMKKKKIMSIEEEKLYMKIKEL